MHIKIILFLLLPAVSLSQNLFETYSVEDGFGQSQVYDVFQDSKGYIWVGTNGGGLSKFDGFTVTNFSTQDGLISNVVNVISEDSQGISGLVRKKVLVNMMAKYSLILQKKTAYLTIMSGAFWTTERETFSSPPTEEASANTMAKVILFSLKRMA